MFFKDYIDSKWTPDFTPRFYINWHWHGRVRAHNIISIFKTWNFPVPVGTAHSFIFQDINNDVQPSRSVVYRIFIFPVSLALLDVNTRLHLLSLRNNHLFKFPFLFLCTWRQHTTIPSHHLDAGKIKILQTNDSVLTVEHGYLYCERL